MILSPYERDSEIEQEGTEEVDCTKSSRQASCGELSGKRGESEGKDRLFLHRQIFYGASP